MGYNILDDCSYCGAHEEDILIYLNYQVVRSILDKTESNCPPLNWNDSMIYWQKGITT